MKAALIILSVLSLLLVPVEALFFNVPAWIFVLAIILVSAMDGVFVWRFAKSRGEKIIFINLNIFIVLFLLFYTFCYPYFGGTVFKLNPHSTVAGADVKITSKQAQADLDFTVKKLNRIHVALRNKNSLEAQKISDAYKSASSYIKNHDEMTVVELAQQIESVLSVLGDAHTALYVNYSTSQHYYKNVERHNVADDDFIGINGVRYEELLKQKSYLYSYEKESWAIKDMINHSISLEGLKYMDIDVSSGVTYMIETADGSIYEESAVIEDFLTYDEYVEYNKIVQREEKPFCYYSIDEEKSLAVFTLKSCRNNKQYSDTLQKMFTEIKQKGIKNLAIDVRGNGGGNSLVVNNLFRYLNIDKYKVSGQILRLGPFLVDFEIPTKKNHRVKDLTFDGDVYLLCSNSSFSSAMLFAQFVKDNNIGKLIGVAPGNNPNGYGEVVHLALPNSHLFVQVSCKKFKRVNQNTDEIYIEPDYPCEADKALDVLINNVLY